MSIVAAAADFMIARLTCGHSFCQDCLQDWFNTTLVQFMAANPAYNPHPPAMQQYMIYLRRPDIPLGQRRAIQRELQAMLDSMEKPDPESRG